MIKPLNITHLWNKAHSHLQPIGDYLSINDTSYKCPICIHNIAFKLSINIYFGQNLCERANPIYCPNCKEYHLLNFSKNNLPLTSVNARLWSSQPTFLNIEPTTRCNFNCWYCVGRKMKQEDIKVENFPKLLNNFPLLKTIALVGEGEPLMHKGFFDMAIMAKKRNIRVMIISNGSTLSQSIIRKLCEAKITYIGISIDSVDASEFSKSRIDGKLEQVLQGIKRLRQFRDKQGFKYPKIGLKGTLFSYSQYKLPDIITTAKAYGVEIFESFQPLNPMITYTPIYPKESLVELEDIDNVMLSISNDSLNASSQLQPIDVFCNQEGIDIEKNGTRNNLRKNCDEQWIYALLSGDITPCCQIKKIINKDWNLFNNSLENILNNHDYENLRFNLWNGLFPNYCKGCSKTC